MKAGDLVRFKSFPHESLHSCGLVGILLCDPYESTEPYATQAEIIVNVVWNKPRNPSSVNNITWDYVDDLEVLNEN